MHFLGVDKKSFIVLNHIQCHLSIQAVNFPSRLVISLPEGDKFARMGKD